jgi:hypothetical protein
VLRRLDEIAAYLSSARDGRRPPRLTWIGRPHTWTMQDARWQAAASAGRASLLSRDEQAQYAFVYAGTREFARLEEEEQDAWAQLRALSELSTISDVQDAFMVAALQRARYAAWLLSVSGGQTRDGATRIGAEPTPTSCVDRRACALPARLRWTKRSAASAPAWSSRDEKRDGAQGTDTVRRHPLARKRAVRPGGRRRHSG